MIPIYSISAQVLYILVKKILDKFPVRVDFKFILKVSPAIFSDINLKLRKEDEMIEYLQHNQGKKVFLSRRAIQVPTSLCLDLKIGENYRAVDILSKC